MKLISRVLRRTTLNWELANSLLKCFIPTQVLSAMAFQGVSAAKIL